MALSTVTANSIVQKWASDYFAEYVRESGFKAYMGKSAMLPIHVKYELTDTGKTVNIPLVTKLTGAGVSGQTLLEGAEEVLNNYNHPVTIDWVRNAVAQTEDQLHWTEMDLLKASKDMLKFWSAEKLRTDIITALGMISGLSYAAASVANRNAWNAANGTGRLLFGRLNSNFNATHATALGNIAAAATLNKGVVTLMKRKAKLASPIVRPIRVDDGTGREYYVMFAGSLAFRDLKADMLSDNLAGRERGIENHPVFQDGDLIYDGVIIKEIPEIPATGNVGTASARVEPVYLCGAQAVAVAWGMQPTVRQETRDYGHVKGTAIIEARGVNKCVYNGIDHGMITGFVAAAADA